METRPPNHVYQGCGGRGWSGTYGWIDNEKPHCPPPQITHTGAGFFLENPAPVWVIGGKSSVGNMGGGTMVLTGHFFFPLL